MKKKLLIGLLSLILLLPNISLASVRLATLINPSGVKIIVVAGSQTAQQYFGDGFVLYTGEPMLGFTVVTNYKTTLSRSISSSASTIYVSSLTTKDNHVLTMADLGTKVFFTLEPGSNKEEIVMCTGVGTLSWTTCTRGLAFYATSTAAVTANQKSHSAGSAIVMSNVHYVYDQLVDKDTANTIDGVKTYTSYPQIQTYVAPTTNIQFAPKKYVDDTINAGAPDATESVKGISELATGAEAAAGTSSGSAARLVLPASIATTTANVAGNHVAITDTDGKLKQDLLDLTDNYTWTGTHTFATSTFSNFNSASSTFTGITSTQWPTASSSIASKGYVDILKRFSASDNLKTSADTERAISTGSYAKYKEIQIFKDGVIRVSFSIKGTGGGYAYGATYINGVISAGHSTTNTNYQTYSDDINVKAGDLVQFYGYNGGNTGYIQNFRLYWDVINITTDYAVNTD